MQDSILFWNAVALEANRISHSDPAKGEQMGPTLSSRALAIVHLAMYDAFAALNPPLPRYLNMPPQWTGPPSTPARDAVAGAAFTTLSALYPAQKDSFDNALSGFNRSSQTSPVPAYDFGVAIGQAMLTLREGDMDARSCAHRPSSRRGRHRPDPDNPGQGFNAPFYGAQTRTFAVSTRHGMSPPPAAGSQPKYLQALRDVRARGIRPDLTGTLPAALFANRRTASETLQGIYWGFDGSNRLGTPPRLYNLIIRQVAQEKGNNEGQNARLFAFVNAAMADAGILAWQHKYCFDYWRPVLGIREHDETLGPSAPIAGSNLAFDDGDPGWLPLGAPNTNAPPGAKNFTPNFPAYPSGHATFGAAAFHITRMFYNVGVNDKNNDTLFPNTFVSEEFNGGNRDNFGTVRPRHTRQFPGGLWQMIMENATSRVLLGVHWIFDSFDFTVGMNGELVPNLGNENIGGVGLGLRIARDIFNSGTGGQAPKMTPPGVVPPIAAAPPGAAMPVRPKRPSAVGGCADAGIPVD